MRRLGLVVGLLVMTLIVGLLAYTAGSRGDVSRVLHGTVYVGADQASAKVGSTYYAVPLDVPWRDIQGTWHEGGRPACLGSLGQSRPITFGAVAFKREGLLQQAVVWVDCSR